MYVHVCVQVCVWQRKKESVCVYIFWNPADVFTSWKVSNSTCGVNLYNLQNKKQTENVL